MQYGQLFWGVLSTFAAFLVGLAWRRLSRVLTHLRARKFWRPLVVHESTVVVGSFRDLPGFEASGMIGMGDNIALNDLEQYFSAIGFRRFTVHYSDHLRWAGMGDPTMLQGNLILLGGPDSNKVTRLVLERVDLGIEFVEIPRERLADPGSALMSDGATDGLSAVQGLRSSRRFPFRRTRISTPASSPWRVPVILDKDTGRFHTPILDGDDLLGDCGIIVRCPNPFNPRRDVIIFCGSYGYGTWAAVRHAQSKAFLDSVPRNVRALECVLAVEVVAGAPQGIRVEILRSIDDPALPPGVSVVVPRIVD